MLIGVLGKKRELTSMLLAKAKTPALIIDCANSADPHRLGLPQERLTEFHVIPIELLYAFRDMAKRISCGQIRQEYSNYATIIITPIDILFNYHDEKENFAMYSQAWESLCKSTETIFIGITRGTIHEQYARSYCDKIIEPTEYATIAAETSNSTNKSATAKRTMGHTASSQRVALHAIEQELRAYAKSLRPADRANFEKLMIAPARHVGSITYASSLHVWAFLLLSICLEQEKRMQLLEEAYDDLSQHIATQPTMQSADSGLRSELRPAFAPAFEDLADRRISEPGFNSALDQEGIAQYPR